MMRKLQNQRVADMPRNKILLMSFLMLIVFVSCSPQKKLAYDFVKKSKGASVAFYVPNELEKSNMRSDCNPEIIDLFLLEEDQLQDSIDSKIKILNKIDDEIFLNVVAASFEETLEDYGLTLRYLEDENVSADSLHWVVDLSHVEIQELIAHQLSRCGVDGNYEFIPITRVNVASWFNLLTESGSELVFTEQNYDEDVVDCYYTLDSLNNLVTNIEFQDISIEGFYNFAVVLGKLYAGYSFDYFMNEYVRREMRNKKKEYSDDIYLRYDPYEAYIYYTRSDKFIPMEGE